MPIKPAPPGVYVEEIPSGVRTITGVATSITAFVGRAKRGPVNVATTINSFSDYERIFGGLDLNSAMSFAARDYFLNGGGQAVIGRLYHNIEGEAPKAEVAADTLQLQAVHEGAWGNALRIRIDSDASAEAAADQGVKKADLFNITICDTRIGTTERYLNVSVVDGPRRIDNVLTQQSSLLHVRGVLPESPPAQSIVPQPGEDPFGDNASVTSYVVTTEASDGAALDIGDYIGGNSSTHKHGLYILKQVDLFNLLCLPPEGVIDDYPSGLIDAAIALCVEERALLLVDSPSSWTDTGKAVSGLDAVASKSSNAALFFPRLKQPNPLRDNRIEEFVACGAVAGVMARTDTQRGVWKAPAGPEASLRGVTELSVEVNNAENGQLNPLGVNCLRAFPNIGQVVWGARTLRGADILADEYRYIAVRRLALFIEESLYRGTQWVVFESNDEPLWAQIRLNAGAFMHNLFRQGALQGTTPRQAYFVKCDKETTPQNDIDRGIVNIVVGFAPLKPAEFVIIKLQQFAGDLEA